MMQQFWTYTLADGRRVLVQSDIELDRYDLMVGFGRVVRYLDA